MEQIKKETADIKPLRQYQPYLKLRCVQEPPAPM